MVLAGWLERLKPLTQSFLSRRVYLQLEDASLTAMACQGGRLVWLEQVSLPDGLCASGEPSNPQALGDFIGDWLVERGYAGARVRAVLPWDASCWRVLEWPLDQWPEDPEQVVRQHASSLGLPVAAEVLDLTLQPLVLSPPRALLVANRSSLLEAWIAVFAQAGVVLDGLEAAQVCLWRGLSPLLTVIEPDSWQPVLRLESRQSRLLVLERHAPAAEWLLPAASSPEALQRELQRRLQFCRERWPAGADQTVLLLLDARSPAAPADSNNPLESPIETSLEWVDPLARGWLRDGRPAPDGDRSEPGLDLLWGLAITELRP